MTDPEFDKAQSELLDTIPEEFRRVFANMAYDRGHSGGNSEILHELDDLIDRLSPAIDLHATRIRKLTDRLVHGK